MRTSKLYSILEHFDKYEQNRCRKYLKSPYFNRDKSLVKLFDLLTKHINGEVNGNELLEKESLWLFIKPKKAYDDVRFRKYCSDLLKLVEGFLAQQIFEENPIQQATYQIQAVGQKKLTKLYKGTMRKARRLSKKNTYRSAGFYFHQYQIENNYYELTQLDLKRTDKSNVEEIATNLDYFYLSEKLRLYCSVLSRQNVVSYEYDLLFIEEILQLIEKYDFEEIPSIAVYYQIYLTQIHQEESHYFKLKVLLEKYALRFPPNEGYIIYTYAINYCIRKINQGNQKFLEEIFSIYKDGIENEVLLTKGKLSPWTFQNVVIIALRLGNYEWTKSFIERYQDKLPEAFRENAVSYNLARLYWYQKRHDKVIELLREVDYEDVSYNLGSKAMLLATYYETDEIEPLYSLLESFRTFLNRHKDIPEQRRKSYKNLIRFTKKLSKIMPGESQSLHKLKEEIEKTKGIADVKWLKEKIAELE